MDHADDDAEVDAADTQYLTSHGVAPLVDRMLSGLLGEKPPDPAAWCLEWLRTRARPRVAAVLFNVRDVAASAAWYQGRLGMLAGPGAGHGAAALRFAAAPGGAALELAGPPAPGGWRDPPAAPGRQCYWKVGVGVPDAAAAVAKLLAAGVDVSDAAQFEDVGVVAHTRDPDGFTVELLQDTLPPAAPLAAAIDPAAPLCAAAPRVGQVTLRCGSAERSVEFWRDGVGMRLVCRQRVAAHRFTLLFFAAADGAPPAQDPDAPANREWTYQLPVTTVEVQCHDDGGATAPTAPRGCAGWAGVVVACADPDGTVARLNRAGFATDAAAREAADPGGARVLFREHPEPEADAAESPR